jgi:hypothetical protein
VVKGIDLNLRQASIGFGLASSNLVGDELFYFLQATPEIHVSEILTLPPVALQLVLVLQNGSVLYSHAPAEVRLFCVARCP